jgi:sporulation protein YlmC with PRC-barrel domain
MRNWFVSTIACAAALCGAAWSAQAADTKVDKTENETVLRAYDVMGMNVRNAQGEKLGDIKDLMIDLGRHPRVRYAALDFGGFLGIGDKLFAVPWQAFKLRHDAKDNDRAFLELDATKESLKNAPGFDKNNWPNFADNRWADEVHKHYRVSTPTAKVDVDVNRKGAADVDLNRKNGATANGEQASSLLRRASKVEGIEVKNAADKKIGDVEDLVIDVATGEVRYVALSFGGFLGVGDKLFAVPWDAVTFEYDANDKQDCLVFDVSKETLSNASGFDKDHWPNFGDPKWKAENQRHYQKDIDRAASRAKQRRG